MIKQLRVIISVFTVIIYMALLPIFYPIIGNVYFMFTTIPLFLMVWNLSIYAGLISQGIFVLYNYFIFSNKIVEQLPSDTLSHVAGIAINVLILVGTQVFKIRYQKAKRSKNEQQKHIETLNSTIANISDIIAILDKTGAIQYVSPNVERFFGWHPNDVLNLKAKELIHPEDYAKVKDIEIFNFHPQNEVQTFEFRFKTKFGYYRIIELTAKNMVEDPLIKGILLNFNDITSRKNNELALKESLQKYQTLIHSMADMVCVLEVNHVISDINAAGVELTGYFHHELVGKTILDLVHPDDKENLERHFERLIEQGISPLYEGRVITKSGKTVWVQINSNKLYEHDKLIGTLNIIRDISQKKESEEQIKALNATKDMLFSIISHDLRNPFFSINGFSELIINQANKQNYEKIMEYASMIYKTSNEAEKLLKNLLDWTRLQTGKLAFMPKPFNLKSELSKILLLFESQATKARIGLSLHVAADIEVIADKNMFDTVIRNLVSNALKFTSDKGLVTIEAKKTESEVEISITDNGDGMDAETLKTLFVFERKLFKTGSHQRSGTGLGLLICKQFIGLHGGKIWAESTLNKGSVFTFTLPYKP